jgi:hypothetical protein
LDARQEAMSGKTMVSFQLSNLVHGDNLSVVNKTRFLGNKLFPIWDIIGDMMMF